MSHPLPRELTTRDLLKTLAIILTVIDHAGLFFFPEEAWFRVIGRFSVPVWFFLVGYADTRKVQKEIWIGGALIVLTFMALGLYLFPLNILFTIAVTRLLLDRVAMRALHNGETLRGMFLILSFLSFPAMIVMEYGTTGFLFAILGIMRRHREELKMDPRLHWLWAGSSMLAYMVTQVLLLPPLTGWHLVVLVVGLGTIAFLLMRFEARVFSFSAGPVLRFTGRRTLEIYVFHIIAFGALAAWLIPGRFSFFRFEIVPRGLLSLFMAQ
ncbi:MAG: hypothetical protein IT558_03415 [Alphaproteobacteria bacterium]|nr:hypothetical protein [Alphaproteobacteria bacterium]